LENPFGPYDYWTALDSQREVVEKHHFNADVEQLTRGMTDYRIAPDIDYTLRVFPNHARALWAMSRLSVRQKRDQPVGANYTIDCYFDRALRFRPNDAQVRLVYGLHLLAVQNHAAAIEQLEKARELGQDDPSLHYNLGLAYFELKDYEKALAEAKLAYQMGMPLPGLRDKLMRVGKWEDSQAPSAPSAAR
jgi:tetratricopeptide (TPR) repeat protein